MPKDWVWKFKCLNFKLPQLSGKLAQMGGMHKSEKGELEVRLSLVIRCQKTIEKSLEIQ